MGGNSAPGFHRQLDNAFYGGPKLPKLPAISSAQRRTMPGGPVMPKLPQNPYPQMARNMVRWSMPRPIQRAAVRVPPMPVHRASYSRQG